MAKIEWTDEAKSEFRTYIINALSEFGESTAKRWQKERKEIEWRLERFPTSFTPEQLLQGKKHLYRGCHIMSVTAGSGYNVTYPDRWKTEVNRLPFFRLVFELIA